MLSAQIDATSGIAILEPDGALSKEDFERAARAIDAQIERAGRLPGIVVHIREFPGWDSFAALAAHLKFVKEHHRKVSRVALCTDSKLGDVAPRLAKHFVAAEVKAFKDAEFAAAKAWAAGGG